MSITARRIFTYLIICLGLLLSFKLIRDINRLRKNDNLLVAAQAELDQAKKEQRELRRQLELNQDSFPLEKEIRNILKMARPNEVVVIIPETVTQRSEFGSQTQLPKTKKTSNLEQWLEVFGIGPGV